MNVRKINIISGFLIAIGFSMLSYDFKKETTVPYDSTIIPYINVSPTPITPTLTPIKDSIREPLPDVSTIAVELALQIVNERLKLCSVIKPTLYDTYSEEELELLFRVVEAEATDYDVECKSHVASVIFNRLKAGWWGGDLTKSIMAKRQFEVITNGRYKRMEVTEETILACEIAFEQDTSQGALFFDSTKGKSWAHENCEYVFSDDAHGFYK